MTHYSVDPTKTCSKCHAAGVLVIDNHPSTRCPDCQLATLQTLSSQFDDLTLQKAADKLAAAMAAGPITAQEKSQ